MSKGGNHVWPTTYPKNVPPGDATPAAGHVFRAVSNVPPTPDDFLTSREENPRREFNDIAQSYAVSFFENIAELQDKIRRYKPLQDKQVVQGNLVDALDFIKKAKKGSHISLWKCIGSRPCQYINAPVKP